MIQGSPENELIGTQVGRSQERVTTWSFLENLKSGDLGDRNLLLVTASMIGMGRTSFLIHEMSVAQRRNLETVYLNLAELDCSSLIEELQLLQERGFKGLLILDDFHVVEDWESDGRNKFNGLLEKLLTQPQIAAILSYIGERNRLLEFPLQCKVYKESQLRCLGLEDIEELVKGDKCTASAGEIFDLAKGYPSLTTKLIEASINGDSLRDCIKTFIFEQFECVQDERLRYVLYEACFLRRFSVSELTEIDKALRDTHESSEYLEAIAQMGDLVEWRSSGGYTINPVFREIIIGYEFENNLQFVAKVYLKWSKTFLTWMERSLKQDKGDPAKFLLDAVYYLWSLAPGNSRYHFSEALEEAGWNEQTLKSLQDKLRFDPELNKLLPVDSIQRMLNHVEEKIESA